MLLPYCHFLLVWEHIPLITISTDQWPTRALHSLAFDMCQVFFSAVAGGFVMFSCCPQGRDPSCRAQLTQNHPLSAEKWSTWPSQLWCVSMRFPRGIPNKAGKLAQQKWVWDLFATLASFHLQRPAQFEERIPIAWQRSRRAARAASEVVILLKVWDSSNSWSIMNINENIHIYLYIRIY